MIDGLKRSMKGKWDEEYPIGLVGVTHDDDNVILNFDLLDYEEINIFDEHLFLLKHNMNPNIIKSNLYYQELGKKEKYRVIVFGNSYVIAKRFVEERIL